MSAESITQIILLATPVVWLAWDIYVFFRDGNQWTESANIWKWAVRLPGIALLVGILIGHLFFQMHMPTEFNTDIKGNIIYQVGPKALTPGELLTVDSNGLFIPK